MGRYMRLVGTIAARLILNSKQIQFRDLPPEILIEVLKKLDPYTLLALKPTCKSWYAATKSREIWYNHVREIESQPGYSKLEEAFTDYTVIELENWVLRRLRVRELWLSPDPPQFTTRSVKIPVTDVQVIPGGRWLIVLDDTGKVHFIDLEASVLEPQLLCEPNPHFIWDGELARDVPNRLVVWVDSSSARLAFRLGLYNNARGYEGMNIPARVMLYSVRLEGHASTARLTAEPMITLNTSHGLGLVEAAALDQNYFVQTRSGGDTCTLHVFRYGPASGSATPSSSVEIETQWGSDIQVLMGERVVIGTPFEVDLYAIPKSDQMPTTEVLSPLHSLKIRGGGDSARVSGTCSIRSHPFFSRGGTNLVYIDRKILRGVHIPHDPWIPPSIIRLGQHAERSLEDVDVLPFIGASCSVKLYPDSSIHVLTYNWSGSEGEAELTFQKKRRERAFADAGPQKFPKVACGFDEDIGRITTMIPRDVIVVFDVKI